MQRFNYKLKVFIKAVVRIAKEKGYFILVENKDSGVRFDLFYSDKESVASTMWVVHGDHDKAKRVWSRSDYKKAAERLIIDLDYFEKVLEEEK